MLRGFLTQFGGQQNPEKILEKGVEYMWKEPGSTIYHTKTWTTTFEGKILSFSNLAYTETSHKLAPDPNISKGHREGTNELGQFWREKWEHNAKTGLKKWDKTTYEGKHLR